MDTLIKQELHQLIDNCDNELLLEEAKSILQNNNMKDWWDELTEEDKTSLTTSEAEYDNGDFITHAQLMQQTVVFAQSIPPVQVSDTTQAP